MQYLACNSEIIKVIKLLWVLDIVCGRAFSQ